MYKHNATLNWCNILNLESVNQAYINYNADII